MRSSKSSAAIRTGAVGSITLHLVAAMFTGRPGQAYPHLSYANRGIAMRQRIWKILAAGVLLLAASSTYAVSSQEAEAPLTKPAINTTPSTGTDGSTESQPVPTTSISLNCGSGKSKIVYNISSGAGSGSCSLSADGKSASCTGAGGSAYVGCGQGCTSTYGGGSCSIN